MLLFDEPTGNYEDRNEKGHTISIVQHTLTEKTSDKLIYPCRRTTHAFVIGTSQHSIDVAIVTGSADSSQDALLL
jgi:hypothetical protein